MASIASFARFAALLGSPARAAMLIALSDGRALTAAELARVAGMAPQTGSGHLAQLSSAGLLTVERRGRIRYHRLASLEVALVIDGLMRIADTLPGKRRKLVAIRLRQPAPRAAPTSCDYLAGLLGAAVMDSMKSVGHIELAGGGDPLTELGIQFLRALGVMAPVSAEAHGQLRNSPPVPYLDWGKGRRHLARALGAATFRYCRKHGWVKRIGRTRAFRITPHGLAILRERFGIEVDESSVQRT